MSAQTLTPQQLLNTLPPNLKALVIAHAADVISDPITDNRYVELSRSGSSVAEYLTWRRSAGTDQATLEKDELALARMCMFRPALTIEEWDAAALLAFVVDTQARYQLADSTMRTNVFVQLKSFWRWACAWKRLPWNPMDLLQAPKGRVKPRVLDTFTQSEQARLLLAASRSVCARRDKCSALGFFDTGARKNDWRLLRWEDVNLADRYVIFRYRKGDKEQALPFGDSLQAALLDAFHAPYPMVCKGDKHRRSPIASDYVLYPNGINGASREKNMPSWIDPSRPMAESTAHRWWYRLLQDAGIVNQGVTSGRKLHLTRHTHGTELYEATGDIEAVRDRLGHVSYETTRLYVHNSRRRGVATVQALETYRAALLADQKKDR